jgi:hypothetical protein
LFIVLSKLDEAFIFLAAIFVLQVDPGLPPLQHGSRLRIIVSLQIQPTVVRTVANWFTDTTEVDAASFMFVLAVLGREEGGFGSPGVIAFCIALLR